MNVCEKEIMYGSTLLASICPVITSICSQPNKYPDPQLQASACLSLAKFMLVSEKFCEENLQLLFTLLERSPEAIIRANLIIALGDMSFRFPNTVEPWTPRMYARLHDESISVRSNTLTVLTHLILNDMIKVKGQISDMACCIVDSVDKIAGLAKLFFSELSKKGNTLYNVMPDIVSRLSDPEKGVEEEPFRTIMKYIFGLIEKDKLLESLVEKLCLRFRATRTERQWRDISFCLSLFPYSDRCLKKLSENFACWSDKLHEDNVYDNIITIFSAVKKGVGVSVGGEGRGAAKQMLEELEVKVEEAREKAVIDNKSKNNKASTHEEKDQKNKKGNRKIESSEEENEEEEDEEEEALPKSKKDLAKKSARKGRKRVEEQEDSEDDFQKDESKSLRRTRRR